MRATWTDGQGVRLTPACAVVALALVGCSSSDPEIRFVYLPLDAAPELAADASGEQAWPDAQPEADAGEAGQDGGAADALEEEADAAQEPVNPCPLRTVLVMSNLCYAPDLPTSAEIAAMLKAGPLPPIGCAADDYFQTTDAGYSEGTACAAMLWCDTHGARLCSEGEWAAGCVSGVNVAPSSQLGEEWTDTFAPPIIGNAAKCATAPLSGMTAHIRCCATPE